MTLTPNAIYKDFEEKNLDKSTAVDLLISLIENAEYVNVRKESIRNIERIGLKSGLKHEKLLKLLENLIVSDLNEGIRNAAISAMKNLFINKSLDPMKWTLQHEKSLNS